MGSELTPEEHATAILTWLRAMFDAGSTLTDASDIARLAPPIAAHIRSYGEAVAQAQRERDAKTIEVLAAEKERQDHPMAALLLRMAVSAVREQA